MHTQRPPLGPRSSSLFPAEPHAPLNKQNNKQNSRPAACATDNCEHELTVTHSPVHDAGEDDGRGQLRDGLGGYLGQEVGADVVGAGRALTQSQHALRGETVNHDQRAEHTLCVRACIGMNVWVLVAGIRVGGK